MTKKSTTNDLNIIKALDVAGILQSIQYDYVKLSIESYKLGFKHGCNATYGKKVIENYRKGRTKVYKKKSKK